MSFVFKSLSNRFSEPQDLASNNLMQLVGIVGKAKGIQFGAIETETHNYKTQDRKLFIATQQCYVVIWFGTAQQTTINNRQYTKKKQ